MISSSSAQMSALAIESRGVRGQQAADDIEKADQERKEAEAAAEEAARAAEAAHEDGGFWGDVGEVAGTVAVVAATAAAAAATGGTALAVIVVVGAAVQMAGKVGEEVGMNKNLALGMQVVGGVTVAAASIASGNVGAVSTFGQTASTVSAGASAAKGGAQAAEAYHEHEAGEYKADGRQAEGTAQLASLDEDRGLSDCQTATTDDLALEAMARDLDTQMLKHRSRMIAQLGGGLCVSLLLLQVVAPDWRRPMRISKMPLSETPLPMWRGC